MNPPELVLDYKNELVVRAFQEKFGVSRINAEMVFQETLRWLLVCSKIREPLPMLKQMRVVDEMWHTFILFTREYREFCDRYLGEFIDHAPTDRSRVERNLSLAELRAALSLIYDQIGQRRFLFWYEQIPKNFPPNRPETWSSV